MLSDFQSLQNGTLSPTAFMRSLLYQRVAFLELSKTGSVSTVDAKSVNCLDIDRIEDRYLLSGYNNGRVYIHELCQIPGQSSYTCNVVNSCCPGAPISGYGHNSSVDTVQWYPFDTGMFTSSGMGGVLKVWDSTNFRPVETVFLPNKIYDHHMSTIATHHSLIAVAGNHPQAILVDLRTGSQCHQLQGHKVKVMAIKWSPFAEHLLATGGADNKLLLWDIRSTKSFLKALDQHNGEALTNRKDLVSAHGGMVNSLCFSIDGLYLLSFGTDNQLRLWDVALGKNTYVNYGKISNESRKRVQIDLCYDATIPVVFVPSQSRILMYQIFTGEKLNTLIAHMDVAKCCVFRNQYHELYSGGNDRQILIWSPDERQNLLHREVPLAHPTLHDAWSDDD